MTLLREEPLLTRAQSRAVDEALARAGMSTALLMENAGRGASERVLAHCRAHGITRVDVLCGPGNNGGDGLVVARHLRLHGVNCRAIALCDPAQWKGDAAVMRDALRATFADALVREGEVSWAGERDGLIVDALFGTGLSRALEGDARSMVERCEGRRVVALDVPSGLDADTGSVMGAAVIRAELTLTFGTSKPGLHTGEGRVLAGEVSVIHLGAPAPIASCERWLAREVTVAPRALDAHKGTAGRVLIVGGSGGTVGAGWLSALGAHRMGAGLVTLASRANSQSALHTIETMTLALDADERAARDAVTSASRATDATVVGPGLGRDPWAIAVLDAVLAIDRPRVLDGDALTLLGAGGARSLGERTVLTPHPLEAARLLGAADAAEINRDRVSAARAIAARYECVAVLKGAGTVIAARDGRVWVLPFAEPTLAIAGSGDVLAGAIAARLADREGVGRPWHEAAIEGAFAHGRAGVTLRARRGTARGALAHELADELAAGW